jgi:hypothetical protein
MLKTASASRGAIDVKATWPWEETEDDEGIAGNEVDDEGVIVGEKVDDEGVIVGEEVEDEEVIVGEKVDDEEMIVGDAVDDEEVGGIDRGAAGAGLVDTISSRPGTGEEGPVEDDIIASGDVIGACGRALEEAP